MPTCLRRAIAAIGIALVWLAAAAPASAVATADAIVECLAENLPARSLRRDLELVVETGFGPQHLRARSYWERAEAGESRLRVWVKTPARVAKASVLMIWDRLRTDVFVYLPQLRRTRKIAPAQLGYSLFGTELRFADLGLLHQLLRDGLSERLPDETVADRDAYVIVTNPGPRSGYDRVVSYIDQRTCVPLEIEFYRDEGDLAHAHMIADAASITRAGTLSFARDLTVVDRRADSELRLRVHSVAVDPEIPRSIFDETLLASAP